MSERMGFDFKVHVPAEEWAYLRRRSTFLEAVLAQVLHDRARVQEWYGAAELAALALPGLPRTKAGITRLARASGWYSRAATGRGGERFEYHFTSLPGRAFDALIARIVGIATPSDDPAEDVPPVPEIDPAPQAPAPAADNAAPSWVLPFMRLLKGANGDLAAAWRSLPDHVPVGIALPTRQEAAETLLRLGLVQGG